MNLKEIIERAGYATRPYSGRAMGGEPCIATEIDVSAFTLIADLVETVHEDTPDSMPELVRAVRRMRTDSYGLRTVVYFPEMQS